MTNEIYPHLVATRNGPAPHTLPLKPYGHHQSAPHCFPDTRKPFIFNRVYATRPILATSERGVRYWAFESREGRDAFAQTYSATVIEGSVR